MNSSDLSLGSNRWKVLLSTEQSFAAAGFIVRLCLAFLMTGSVLWFDAPDNAIPFVIAVCVLVALAYRVDFLNCWIAFSGPWLLVLLYSALPLSSYSRPVSKDTIFVVVLLLALGLVLLPSRIAFKPVVGLKASPRVNNRGFTFLLLAFLAFCVLNVVIAGYVPLVNAVLYGDSGYMAFGMPGLYGLFNAYANAFGLTAFYLWMILPGRRLYKYSYFVVLVVFLMFVTRQNLMSLAVESLVVYCALVRKVSGLRLVILAALVLAGFGALGDLREGSDIRDLAAITDEYLWLPKALVWLFAYCYFNILNMDNVIVAFRDKPLFDGSSVATLLPSILRPEIAEIDDFREVSTFTVESFISPLYRDLGLIGVAISFALFCLAVRWYMRKEKFENSFIRVTGYAVLFFCFLFSFFVNFWFYLPVIFQLIFFPLFGKLIFPKKSVQP